MNGSTSCVSCGRPASPPLELDPLDPPLEPELPEVPPDPPDELLPELVPEPVPDPLPLPELLAEGLPELLPEPPEVLPVPEPVVPPELLLPDVRLSSLCPLSPQALASENRRQIDAWTRYALMVKTPPSN
jgi:hypothetical protein